MDAPYCRNAADVQAAVEAILQGGNAGLWYARENYGVSAQWGDDGKVSITGTLLIERNAEAFLSETVEPQIVTTTSETRPEVITTRSETRPQTTETAVTTELPSVQTQTNSARQDQDQVSQGGETTTTTSSGSDVTHDYNVWVLAEGAKIQGQTE